MDNQDTIDVLNTLIETCNDGERGFRNVAEHVHSDDLKTLFATRASECRQACADLRAQVLQLGGDPETGGSASGALHRGWVSLLARCPATATSRCWRPARRARTRRWNAIATPSTKRCRTTSAC